MNLFLRGQHQKAEQQRKQHVKPEHARHAVLGEDQLVGQLRQHRKPKKPPGVLGFGMGVAVAFHEEIAHGHGSKIADVQAKIRQRCPAGINTLAMWFTSIVAMASILMVSRFIVFHAPVNLQRPPQWVTFEIRMTACEYCKSVV